MIGALGRATCSNSIIMIAAGGLSRKAKTYKITLNVDNILKAIEPFYLRKYSSPFCSRSAQDCVTELVLSMRDRKGLPLSAI